jgi:hypothetical protein
MKNFIIRLNKATKNHPNTLKTLGYTVNVQDNLIHITAEGSIDTEVDLTQDPKATIAEVIKRKFLFTYATRFKTNQGIRYGVPAARALDAIAPGLSALIAYTEERYNEKEADRTAKANRPTLKDFLGL